jgi:lysophospholipase L1-like esterase
MPHVIRRSMPHVMRRWRSSWAALTLVATLAACSGSGAGTPPAARTSSPTPATDGLHLVVIGDSIPYNSSNDCLGCTGFVDRYAKALQMASGKPVTVENHSQHNGLTLPMLLDELADFKASLSAADAIIIGIAHNSMELNQDKPCGGSLDAHDLPDWSRLTRACAVASAAKYRPQYEQLFSTVAAWRQGRPTLLRTVNRYNDWVGAPGLTLTKADGDKTRMFIDLWDSMLCATATNSGFGCADIYHRFNGPRGDKPSGDLLAGDYTHPSNSGNAVIAETLVAQGFAPLAASPLNVAK